LFHVDRWPDMEKLIAAFCSSGNTPKNETHFILYEPLFISRKVFETMNPLNAELNPICPLLALLGAHHILHVSR